MVHKIHTRLKITLLALLPCIAAVAAPKAVVKTSVAHLYSRPDFEASIETQELMGGTVEILEQDGLWIKVRCNQPYDAWTSLRWLEMMDGGRLQEWLDAPKYIFTALYGSVFSAPDKDSQPICDLVAGDVLACSTENGRAQRRRGWSGVLLPDGSAGWVESGSLEDKAAWEKKCLGYGRDERIASAIGWAVKMMGIPYLWGGMSAKGFDCSGLTRFVYLMSGVRLPRNASQQIGCGTRICIPVMPDGKFDLSALKPGDLVFFGHFTDGKGSPADTQCKPKVTHVGLYLGDGRMIHSSHLVRINSLVRGSADCYENVHLLVGACRIVQ